MIEAKDIRELERELIESTAEKEHKAAEENRSASLELWMQSESTRQSNFELVEKAQKDAERCFPEAIKKIDAMMRDAVNRKKYSVLFECLNSANPYSAMFLKIMVIQALTIGGFLCRLREEAVVISW